MANEVPSVTAYAVLRAPLVLAADEDLNNQVKVVSVWPTLSAVESEVARLEGLVAAPEADRYWWQSTHLHEQERIND